MEKTHLFFDTSIGVKKPENIRNKSASCPFCDRNELAEIIAEDGPILLVKNKYPVLDHAFQTVLIETDECKSDISSYSFSHLVRLFDFALTHWQSMIETEEYQSVLLFKNHGPLSGGSIAHPHMQIIGLKEINYKEKLQQDFFEGLRISEKNDVQFNLSTKPRVGFYEFNIRMHSLTQLETFAGFIQTAVHYILHHFPFKCSSYNLFFYQHNGEIIAKITPRFVTTPIFIGYSIPQVPSNLDWMRKDIISRYYERE